MLGTDPNLPGIEAPFFVEKSLPLTFHIRLAYTYENHLLIYLLHVSCADELTRIT